VCVALRQKASAFVPGKAETRQPFSSGCRVPAFYKKGMMVCVSGD